MPLFNYGKIIDISFSERLKLKSQVLKQKGFPTQYFLQPEGHLTYDKTGICAELLFNVMFVRGTASVTFQLNNRATGKIR